MVSVSVPVQMTVGPSLYRRLFTSVYVFQTIIFSAGIILGSIVIVNLFYYPAISLPWKIAITTFIVILPISFFLQAYLLAQSTVNSIASDLQSKFYNKYQLKRDNIRSKLRDLQKQSQSEELDLASYPIFFEAFKIILDELDDDYLNEYYKIIFEKLSDKDYYSDRGYNEKFVIDKINELDQQIWEHRTQPGGEEYITQKDAWKQVLHSTDQKKVQDRMEFLDFIFGAELKEIISDRMEEQGINFRAYINPISFFMFIYFAGILVTLPLLNSVFTGEAQNTYIPLFNENELVIPIEVIQWGFIGGLVYTSINLLNRFFRMDLHPKIYLSSSFRLIFATVAAVVIQFLFIISNPDKAGADMIGQLPAYVLLACFTVGIAPIQFLIRVGQSVTLEIMDIRRKRTSGNDNVIVVDGINMMVGERLGEAGIDSVQQLALCKPDILSRDTKFDILTICDWKDQALLYLYTDDVKVTTADPACKEIKATDVKAETADPASKEIKLRRVTLHELLNKRLGIRNYSGLKNKWNEVKANDSLKQLFFNELGIIGSNGTITSCTNLFDNITTYEDQYIRLMDDLKTGKYTVQSKGMYTETRTSKT